MNNSDLIAKLNNFKKIKLNQKWLNSNRELLLAQISNSGAESLSPWKILLINLSSLSKAASQPVYALGIFVLLIITGSLLGQQMLVKAKPNDSLYIARIIAENVKVNTTLNTRERNKLAAQYALIHAQDINKVLANPHFNTPANRAQVAKLNVSFNQEVNVAKNRIKNLNDFNSNLSVKTVSKKTSNKSEILDLIMADSSKDKQGISVAINKNLLNNIATGSGKIFIKTNLKKTISSVSTNTALNSSTTLTATSTNLKSSSTLKIVSPSSKADKILDEAKKLSSSKDYNQSTNKLKEVENIIK